MDVITVMAAEGWRCPVVGLVIGEGDIAVGAGDDVTTTATRYKGAVSPPMDEKNTLLPLFQ